MLHVPVTIRLTLASIVDAAERTCLREGGERGKSLDSSTWDSLSRELLLHELAIASLLTSLPELPPLQPLHCHGPSVTYFPGRHIEIRPAWAHTASHTGALCSQGGGGLLCFSRRPHLRPEMIISYPPHMLLYMLDGVLTTVPITGSLRALLLAMAPSCDPSEGCP